MMGQVCLLVDRVSGFVIAGEKHWEGLQHHQITNQSFRPGAHDTELSFLDSPLGMERRVYPGTSLRVGGWSSLERVPTD